MSDSLKRDLRSAGRAVKEKVKEGGSRAEAGRHDARADRAATTTGALGEKVRASVDRGKAGAHERKARAHARDVKR